MEKGFKQVLLLVVMLAILLLFSLENDYVGIKMLFILVFLAFLLPSIKSILIKDEMRNLKTAIYTSVTFTVGLFLFGIPTIIEEKFLEFSSFMYVAVVFFFCLLGNLIYGVPVTIIADYLSSKVKKARFFFLGIVHVGFGLATYFFYPGIFIAATICSVLFFLYDELLRR